MSYHATRDRLEDYFGRSAADDWTRLTSDAPVSRIRQTVREGRDAMRATLLAALPDDLTGARVLDAGCGPGDMAQALARRGADVVAVDLSPALLSVARARCPDELARRIMFVADDMADAGLGRFDHVVAMDSLIHYATADIAATLAGLAARTDGRVVFTVAPATPVLTAMWRLGQLFPRSDRSPAIRPVAQADLTDALARTRCARRPRALTRIHRGFYISQAMELAP